MPLEMVIRLPAEPTGIVGTCLKPLRQRGQKTQARRWAWCFLEGKGKTKRG